MGKKTGMADLSVGFIGGGRITQLLLAALNKKGKLPERICVSDSSAEVLSALKQKFPQVEAVRGNNGKAAACDLVFLALHPPAIAAVLDEIKGALKPSATVISLAPKVSIAGMSQALGGFAGIVRMIPNAPSVINEGYNPVAFSAAIDSDEKKDLLQFFESFGACPEVKEGKLEAYAILAAMGPTYFWFQMQKLRELGGTFGLTADETDQALYEMIQGAAKTLFKSGMTYESVVNLVPVKPLDEEEQDIRQIYETRLTGLYTKLKS